MFNPKKIISNPSIMYVASRYGTYIIQFINSIFIAVYLGPYYLGIWGFINLIIGYVGQINLGVPYSVNVIISIKKQNETYVRDIIGNGLSMLLIIATLTFVFFMLCRIGIIEIGNKFYFDTFIVPVIIISVLTHINGYFSNIFRVFGKIYAIALNQSLYPIIILFLIPFFRGKQLLWAMLFANCAAFIISFLIYLSQFPIRIKPLVNWRMIKYIQIKGWYLFVYGASFYLIILTTNTFISGNYDVKEFGYYTFSYSLANVVLLLLNSISFLIFPKIINRFANSTNEQISNLLTNVRTAYISLSHLLIHFVIMLFPTFLLFFPDYSASSSVFKFTALTIVLYTNSFGYQGVLMAKGKEKQIAIIAFSTLILNTLLCAIFVYWLRIPFSMVILATLISYLIYVFVLGIFGRKILELKTDFISVLKDIYPWRMMLPFGISLTLSTGISPDILFVIPFLIYLMLNYKDIHEIRNISIKIIKNPNFINI